ncbi:MAG: hydroxymethylpyrimidine/phosphomethylpyrimidine kinase [Bacteroidota bacterium]
MLDQRKYVVSIAGLDPSAGAGLLADVKCFEQHQIYGFGVCSALTVQTDETFIAVQWLSADQIIAQLTPLLAKFELAAVKIGLIRDLGVLETVVNFIRTVDEKLPLVLDPVLSASAGFNFHNWNANELVGILKQINLITPNYSEMKHLAKHDAAESAAAEWATYCPVLLKGGHNPDAKGTDLLFKTPVEIVSFDPVTDLIYEKHGSGCVLSSAIAANLAQGHTIEEACSLAKAYTAQFLNSSSTLLGYHHVQQASLEHPSLQMPYLSSSGKID